MLKKIIACTLFILALLSMFSCQKENFDTTVTETEEFEPTVNMLPFGTWQVEIAGVDTIVATFDTVYCDQIGSTVTFFPYAEGISVRVKFHSDTNPDLLSLGEYGLTAFEVVDFNNATGQYEPLWSTDQVDAIVEITESISVFDPLLNINTNAISGFINGVITDVNGIEYTLSSSFNKITRYKL